MPRRLGRLAMVAAAGAVLLLSACSDGAQPQLLLIPPREITDAGARLAVEFSGGSQKDHTAFLYRETVYAECPPLERVTVTQTGYRAEGWLVIPADPGAAAPDELKYGEVNLRGLKAGTSYAVCAVALVDGKPEFAVDERSGRSVQFKTDRTPTPSPTATRPPSSTPSPSPTPSATPSPTPTAPPSAPPAPRPVTTSAPVPAPAPPVVETPAPTQPPTPIATASPPPAPPAPAPTPRSTPSPAPTPVKTPEPVEDEGQASM